MKLYMIIEEAGACSSDLEYQIIETHTSKVAADALAEAFNKAETQEPDSTVWRYVYEFEPIEDGA